MRDVNAEMEAGRAGRESCEVIGIIGIKQSNYISCQFVPISNARRQSGVICAHMCTCECILIVYPFLKEIWYPNKVRVKRLSKYCEQCWLQSWEKKKTSWKGRHSSFFLTLDR